LLRVISFLLLSCVLLKKINNEMEDEIVVLNK